MAIAGDGTALALTSGAPGARDIAVLTLTDPLFAGATGSQVEPREFLATSADEWSPIFSPDGRHLAYTSNESGREEVYVMPYPGPGGKSLVSRGGGAMPRWNSNGRELFYLSPANELMVATVGAGPVFSASAPSPLFKMPPIAFGRGWGYDVVPDGARFIVRKLTKPGSPDAGELRVVVNWIDELERSMAAAER